METILFTIVLFALCFLGLGIGALSGKSRLKGSCGGIGADGSMNPDAECSVCGGEPSRCANNAVIQDQHYSRLHRKFQ